MKSFKENKGQILAVLALGLALGLAMPGAAFATEGDLGEEPLVVTRNLQVPTEIVNDAPIEENTPVAENAPTEGATQNESTGNTDEAGETEPTALSEGATVGGGANEGEEAVSQDVAENIVELNKRIQTRDTFAGYRKAAVLGRDAAMLDAMNTKYDDLAAMDGGFNWDDFSEEEQEAMKGKSLLEIVAYIKTLPEYTEAADTDLTKIMIDAIEENVAKMTAELKAQVKALLPTVTGVDEMNLTDLIAAAKTLPNYAKISKLALAMTTVDGASAKLATGTELTAAVVKAAYNNSESEMMKGYNAMAVAALEFDDSVMNGLMSYELPETSVGTEQKPQTPNTGALDATDASALDLALVTTLAAGGLALLGGAALVAKLYLCHKF